MGLLEDEAHPRVPITEPADDGRDEPGAEGELEGDGDGAALRVDQLLDRGEPVVEAVDERVDMALEGGPGESKAQHAAAALEQRGADLLLEAGQGAGDRGLADLPEVAHLGDRRPVGDLLEPAQDVGLHIHNPVSYTHLDVYKRQLQY